ncbi:MAG TPA: heme-binding protein [Chloroflexota bacterium]|jgi:glc operon protein GlcG|nr:heme-binding protein [Chloroflexota bacterium]
MRHLGRGIPLVVVAVLGLVAGLALGTARAPVGAAAAAPAAPAEQGGTSLNYDQAARLVQAAMEYAQAHNYRMSFVVLDAGGHLLAAGRMDGAHFLTPEIARGKAYAPAATGRSGSAMTESFQANPALWGNAAALGYGAPLLPARGALPLFRNGVLLGAMGASGGTAEQDEEAVRAALQALGFQETPS